MRKLVTIIVPIYNVGEKLLRTALDSISQQTYQNFECLMVDDGSTDGSGEICDEYTKRDSRFKVLHVENQGVSTARNIGLDNAKGEYIAFVDGDDQIEPSMLQKFMNNMQETEADICACCCEYIFDVHALPEPKNEKRRITELNASEAIEALCYYMLPYEQLELTAVWGKLYRANLIKDIRFDKQMSVGEDFDFNFRAFTKAGKIVISNEKSYGYYLCDSGAMRSGFSEKKMRSLSGLERVREEVAGTIYCDAVISRLVNIALVLLMMIPLGSKYQAERTKLIQYINRDRKAVLHNHKTRKKVKISLALSYLGYDVMQVIFKIVQKLLL